MQPRAHPPPHHRAHGLGRERGRDAHEHPVRRDPEPQGAPRRQASLRSPMPTYGLNRDPNSKPYVSPFAPKASPTVYDDPATQSARATGSALAQQGQGVAGAAAVPAGVRAAANANTAASGVPPALQAELNAAVQSGRMTPAQASAQARAAAGGGGQSSMLSPTFSGAQAAGMMGATGRPAPTLPAGSSPASMQAPGPPAFQTGQRATAQNLGGIQDVNTASLGGYSSVMGGLGAAPGAIAGQLGAAPQVGQVGNIQTGSAPGAIAGQLGTMGASSADQQGMMSRLNQFLDTPNGPSVAEAQLQQAQANNVGQMLGLARSGRGGAGAQAQALAGAMSEGSALASDTAGQLATLRAQEEDMRRGRTLSAIGLGGDLATAARGQDLGYRGQDLSALQGDQSTALGSRGQDIQAAMANQSTQSQLEQLRAQTALGARGQDLSALQGDQSVALGARGQNLQGLTADQSASIAARGQNLSALQGNQATALGMRGQNVAQEGNILGANTAMRGQDLTAVTGDADRNLAAQQLALQGKLGFGGLQNQASGQGLDFLSNANQQALGAEGMAQAATMANKQNLLNLQLGNQANDTSRANTNTMAAAQAASQPSFLQSLLPVGGTIAGAILGGPIGAAIGGGIGAGAQSQIRRIDSQNPYG